VVFRLGFAVSRPSARQFVSHRHVLVNGKRLNIPSYQVRAGEAISLSSEALNIPSVKEALKEKDRKIPDWLKRKAAVGMITREPKMEDILEPINVQDIVEFYSR